MSSSRKAGLPPFRITRIEAAPLFGESPKGGWSAEIRPEDSIHAIIAVHTDQGLTGYGSVFTDGRLVQAGLKVLEPLYRDEDALTPERVSEKLHQNTFWMGRGGTLTHTISGIDIALWDIAGKFHELPVYKLLGGAFRTRVQPYATGFYRVKGQGEAQRLGEEALRHFEAGFSLMKVKLGYGVDDDVSCMKEIGRAIQGKSITLMVDTNHAYGRAEALKLGRALDEFNLRWYEEPVVPEDVQGYVEMRQKLSMPIAGGENEHSLYGFREFLGAGAVDVAQPDLGSCGGLSAGRHIVALAQSHGVQVNPHVWGSAIAQAASLQFIAALPVAHHSLFAQEPVLEYDRSSHPFRQYLVKRPIELTGGWVEIPSRPGLGVDVDRTVVDKFSV